MSGTNQRNIEIDDNIWKNVGVLAAQLSITKKELVRRALEQFLQNNIVK
jgi:predicted transcriptional regulator